MSKTTGKPNILVILSDQLRRQALGVYGDPNAQTPNIDRLAAGGACFDNACSTYAVCVPFRYTLMTGHYAHRCLIPTLGWRMSPAERTLADGFNDSGYQTAYFGKWHLYGGPVGIPGYSPREENDKPVPRSHQGRWRYWRGFELCNAPFETNYFADDDPTPRRIDGYQPDGLTHLLLNYLENDRDRGQPFCAVLSVEPPHPPFQAPQELEDKWLATDIELPPNFMRTMDHDALANLGHYALSEAAIGKTVENRKRYYAMIENFDSNVGRIVDALDRLGLADNTMIVLMSDHGEMGGAHGAWAKVQPYEESIGIPLLVSGPGVPSARLDVPVSTEDLFPSIMGLAGLAPTAALPGSDLTPLIRGAGPGPDRPGVMLEMVWEQLPAAKFHRQIWRGFRSRDYKYTVIGDLENGLRPWQFFDLRNDPYELCNLIDSQESRNLIDSHHQWLHKRMREVGDDAVTHLKQGACPC